MAATASRGRCLRLMALGVLLASTLLAWVASNPARAGNTVACADLSDTVEIYFDKPGVTSKASVGYTDTGAANDILGYRHRGTEANGTPIESSGSCGNGPGGVWTNLGIELGDRADSARLDARKPRVAGRDPIPGFVDVVIDGGKGDDALRGHKGYDEIYGSEGDDVIRIAGGGGDVADCGQGRDKVVRSGTDLTSSDCEKVVG